VAGIQQLLWAAGRPGHLSPESIDCDGDGPRIPVDLGAA
jgi:hypothetical protein